MKKTIFSDKELIEPVKEMTVAHEKLQQSSAVAKLLNIYHIKPAL